MVMGKCITPSCENAKHSYEDYAGKCCKGCKEGKDKHDHECQNRKPCQGKGCKFFMHSVKYQHGFCCDKCEAGKGHGPMCEKIEKDVVGDTEPPPPPPAPIATGPCCNEGCIFHVHTSEDFKGACCSKCKPGGKDKHDHWCEQRPPCTNADKCGFFRHSTKYQHGACCDVCDSKEGKSHGPMCEKIQTKK